MKKSMKTYLAFGLVAGLLMPCTAMAEQIAPPSQPASVQQAKPVKGNVVDENGEPLIGVSVKVIGAKGGAVTDLNGDFSVNGAEGKKLQFSYTGYKTQTVSAGRGMMTIKMEPDVLGLDDVVVIGYGTQKKRDLTGAITTIKSGDVTINPNANPMEALQGKVAGLDITKESGQAGAGINMQLRGTRSFSASGDPTFIIDGMPGDYSTLNPNDIESIEILKDASSTAIYGSAGANGVVLITTKAGALGRTKVDFNAYLGINGWSTLPEMRTGEQFIQGIRDAEAAIGNWTSPADDQRVIDGQLGEGAYAAHQKGQYINWPETLLKTAITQNYSVAISGGTEKTKAYMSFNFSSENGQYDNDNYKIYSTNIRIDHKLKDWLSVGVNTRMSYVHQNKAYTRLDQAMRRSPIGTLYEEDGSVKIQPTYNGGTTNISLLLNDKSNYRNNDQNFKLYLNPYVEIRPLKGLSILSRFQANLDFLKNNYFQGVGSYLYYNESGASSSGTNTNVYAAITNRRHYNYKWENVITYNFQIAEDHDITLTGVTSWNHNRYEQSYQKETNITDNAFLWYNMGKAGDANSTVSSSYTMSKGMGLVGRVNYSYQGKYLASASIRYDGSSVLAEGNRWDVFPAFSVGWRISDEQFMEKTKSWLDNLKIRFGYGVTGTASINPYSTASTLEQTNLAFGDKVQNTYRYRQYYANTDLTWEKSYNSNLGLDATFLNNRINMSLDFYWTKTKGVIWDRELPVTNGAYKSDNTMYKMYQNLCETKNRGIELTLNTRNIVTKDFTWTSDLTFTYNKEKITALSHGITDNYQRLDTDYALSIGHPVNSYYQYKLDGIWQKGEEADAEVFGCKPGDIKINVPDMYKEADGRFYKINEETGEKTYYDKDNKYTYSSKDYQVIGHNSPDWSMGFKNTFTYKGFDLSIFMYWRYGQMIKYDMMGSYDPTGVSNFPAYFNYWTENNPSNDFPAINAGRPLTQYTGYSGLVYQDGSFFKIKNITLGYTLPKSLINRVGITNCRIYGTITNPLVVAKNDKLKDYDPEMNGSFDFPLTRQMVFGINLSF